MKTKNVKQLKFKSTYFLIGINLNLAALLILFQWSVPVKSMAKIAANANINRYNTKFELPIILNEEKILPNETELDLSKIEETEVEPAAIVSLVQSKPAKYFSLDTFFISIKDREITICNLPDETIYTDYQAEFVLGSIQDFVKNRINVPEIVKQYGLSGDVLIEFVVEKDGTVSKLNVLTPPNMLIGYGVEEACLNVIKLSSGNWQPAKRGTESVRSLMRFPIEFDYSKY